ncbi:6634_t:CDS:2 [Funneliformis geosporum]|uniref:874_t:CDS:1 n=1 Tax=Funneliformis geosporum TaxID=1117311 RepID=A0A9W4SC66_9GLOM|nr:874_t:CDS:2 [Funneliformis geosporum]CAI2174805.1 6634_t:CDS:2 [Funneliformis geosporum]
MGNSSSAKNKKESYGGNYMIKVNEEQIDRIQVLHHILKTCCNDTNFSAPIYQDLTRGIKVLDVGSGPGTWIFDMSSDFPRSQFVGIEIQSFMLPTIHPSNTHFIHNDILHGIPFPPNSFDYIHMRNMNLCFTEKQYEQIIRELIDLLKPNGYLELCEQEISSYNMGPVTRKISDEMGKILIQKSMNPFVSSRLHVFMKKYGLQKVQREMVMLPMSELDGKIGSLHGQSVLSGLLGVKDVLAKQMKLTGPEANQLLNDYRKEIQLIRMYVSSRKLKQKEKFEGNYIIKVDEMQIDRIQQMHHVLKSGFDNTNYYAPITRDLLRGIEVLDVGTGPGTWLFDMSSDFPKSQFTGIEIQSFMLPTIHPSNTKFVKNDILQGISFPPNSFDFIHMRNMTLCFTEEQYEQIINGLVDLLRPNGYLEISEPEMASLNMGPTSKIISDASKSRSMNPFINEKLHDFLEKSGLKHVTRQDVLLPISELDGKVGALYGHIIFSGLLGLKDILAKQMKLSKNGINSLLDDYLLETKRTRMYSKYTRVYGKKIINDIV